MAVSGTQKTSIGFGIFGVGRRLTITAKASAGAVANVVPFAKGLVEKGVLEGAMSLMGTME